MWWSPNTIKPNPLSSLIFLKRHHLTLFPYYHPAKIKNFPIFLPQKKKKKKSHQVINILHFTWSLKTKNKKKLSRFMQSVFHRLVAEKQGESLGFNSFFFFFFFKFWFLYWISYRIVKKDRSFIVFWDWIGMWNQIIFLGFIWFLKRLNLR